MHFTYPHTVLIYTEPPLVGNTFPFCPDRSLSPARITCVVDRDAASAFSILPRIVTPTAELSCNDEDRLREDFEITVLFCNATLVRFQQELSNRTCGNTLSCMSDGRYYSQNITFQLGKL